MLTDEIRHMWFSKTRAKTASWLFFLTRYVSLVAHIPSIVAIFGMDLGPKVCAPAFLAIYFHYL
jgi:hypothetical protein